MFQNDYSIKGLHATYLKALVEMKAFERYIDVYLAAAMIGRIYGKCEEEDSTSTDKASILAEAFYNERSVCIEIFRNVILSDSTKKWSDEDKMKICFKYEEGDDDALLQEAIVLFNSYSRAGVRILYNFFADSKNEIGEIIDDAYIMISELENRSIDMDDNQLLSSEY